MDIDPLAAVGPAACLQGDLAVSADLALEGLIRARLLNETDPLVLRDSLAALRIAYWAGFHHGTGLFVDDSEMVAFRDALRCYQLGSLSLDRGDLTVAYETGSRDAATALASL